jgi:hypothetical protein
VYANLKYIKGGGGDFYVLWAGSRAFVVDKMEPYSGEVAGRVQELVYHDAAAPGQKPYILEMPFHLLLLFFPFSLFSDPSVARAFFTLILEGAVLILALLSLRLTESKVPRLYYFLFVGIAGLNYYSSQAIYAASPVLLLGLAYAGILVCLRNGMDEMTGALLAVSIQHWEVGAPFLILVILRASHEKRTGVLAGFFMTSFILLAISFLLYPGWVISYLRALVNNRRTDFGLDIRSVLDHLLPSFGHSFAWIFVFLLLLVLLFEWSRARNADFRRFYWAACLSLAAAPLLGFRTEIGSLAVLVIPMALIFSIIHDRWQGLGAGVVILWMVLIMVFPWLLYFKSRTAGGISVELVFIALPMLTIMGLYWMRWWALHPPRTWIDLAGPP